MHGQMTRVEMVAKLGEWYRGSPMTDSKECASGLAYIDHLAHELGLVCILDQYGLPVVKQKTEKSQKKQRTKEADAEQRKARRARHCGSQDETKNKERAARIQRERTAQTTARAWRRRQTKIERPNVRRWIQRAHKSEEKRRPSGVFDPQH